MDRSIILEKVVALAGKQFGEDLKELVETTTAADITGWNSLNHVMLISSIEQEFGIRFDLLQMTGMKSIGDITDATLEALK